MPLYIGQFDFRRTPGPGEPTDPPRRLEWGHFTTIIEADDPDAAVTAFRACIRRTNKRAELFDPGTQIYLASMVELARVPTSRAALIQYEVRAGDGAIGCALPVSVRGAVAYHAEPEDDEAGIVEAFVEV